jgi:3-oxoacyl-(acyl-carrier-protein) synthase
MIDPVAITGLGVVSAAGAGAAASLRMLRSGARPAWVPCPVADLPAPPPMFAAAGTFPETDRTFHLALAAVGEALQEAGLDPAPAGFRLGVCLGTTVACQLNDIGFYKEYRATGNPSLEPVERFASGSLAERVARRLGATGPAMTVVNACSSGTDALGVARIWLETGRCDAVLAGGADELSAIPASGFFALGLCSPEPCKPFDRARQGLNLGEGAGVVLLERRADAEARGRTVSLLASGFGAAADGHHLTAPHPDGLGLEAAVRAALREAGIGPEEIDFVNAHGTSTPENDRIEGAVLARIFGPGVRVVSTKGSTGHTLGAAGGIEAVFTALALREGWISPTVGFETRDDAIPFAPLAEIAPVVRRHALSTSLAFGGNNAAIVLSRAGGDS